MLDGASDWVSLAGQVGDLETATEASTSKALLAVGEAREAQTETKKQYV